MTRSGLSTTGSEASWAFDIHRRATIMGLASENLHKSRMSGSLRSADSNPPLFLRHFGRKQDSRARGSDPCDSFSGDVVGRSVCWRTYGKRKATQQRNAAI